jgi:glucosamine--fructose-6-phosphate aminotransferase (isomerizing)
MNKFLKEIFEQPAALEKTLDYYMGGDGQDKLEKLSALWENGKFTEVIFTGMGSSFFAPHTASCLLSRYGIGNRVINAGELLHYHLPQLKENSLLMCISQSGESYEIVRILEKIQKEMTCIGITNDEKSTLSAKTNLSLLSRAGHEEMTSSKTYVSTLLVLSVFTSILSKTWKADSMPGFKNAIEAVDKMINSSEKWLPQAAGFLGHPSFVQIIGRGPSYSSVLQGALMFMEAARNPAAGIYGGEFRHGPMEMAKKGFRAVILAPLGSTYDQGIKLADDITKYGGKVVLITNSLAGLNNPDIHTVHIPCQDEYLFPIPAIIPLQLIVNQWAVDEGNEPGNFTMGAKVTTTE